MSFDQINTSAYYDPFCVVLIRNTNKVIPYSIHLKTQRMEMDIIQFLQNSAAAAAAGASMGFERQIKQKHAGLKTNTLVALGANTFIMLAVLFNGAAATDMTRIIGQVVVGVGFLGAGVIMQRKDKEQVEGMATAATIWCSAAAGCLAGFKLYLPLLSFTILVVIINLIFGYLNNKVGEKADE